MRNDAPREHVHDAACPFGHPQCPAFMEESMSSRPNWFLEFIDFLGMIWDRLRGKGKPTS